MVLSVPLQLQVVESEFVPISYNHTLDNGHVIKAGIEFNKLGKRVAYYMHREHPAEFAFDSTKLIRVKAENVLHVFEASASWATPGPAITDTGIGQTLSPG